MNNRGMKILALLCGAIVTIGAVVTRYWYPWSGTASHIFIEVRNAFSFLTVPFLCYQLFDAMTTLDSQRSLRQQSRSTVDDMYRDLSNARQEAQQAKAEAESMRSAIRVREDADQLVKRQINELKESVEKSIRASGGKGQIRAKGMVGNVEISITTEIGGPHDAGRVVRHSSERW